MSAQSLSHIIVTQLAQWWRIRLPMQEMWVQSLCQKDPLEKEMATHSSILAPWIEEPDGVQSMGSQRDTTEWLNSNMAVFMLKWRSWAVANGDHGICKIKNIFICFFTGKFCSPLVPWWQVGSATSLWFPRGLGSETSHSERVVLL